MNISWWKKLRSHYWLALSFDLCALMLVLWGLHAWQTRDLPIGELAMPTELPELASGTILPAVRPGAAGVIYFFAPWCSICRHSISNLDEQVRDGSLDWASAIALDYGNEAEVAEFVNDTGIDLPVLLGSNQTAADWEIRGFPTYFVIDANGNISSRSVGYSTALGIRWRVWLAGFGPG